MGYTTSTVHGIEVPNSSEANNVPEDIGKVVAALESGSLVKRLTGAAIAALTAPQKPAGLVVYNTTTGKLQISDGTNFADVDETAVAALPKAGGTMSGAIAMGGQKVTGLAAGTASSDAATKAQVDAAQSTANAALPKAGGTMSGILNMGGHNISAANAVIGRPDSDNLILQALRGQIVVQSTDGVPFGGTIAHAPASYGNQSATLGQVPSSRDVKQNITDLSEQQRAAFDLVNPVAFEYRPGEGPNEVEQDGTHLGFIAEDVQAAGLRVLVDSDGTVFGLQPIELIAVLWAKVQDLEERISAKDGV